MLLVFRILEDLKHVNLEDLLVNSFVESTGDMDMLWEASCRNDVVWFPQ